MTVCSMKKSKSSADIRFSKSPGKISSFFGTSVLQKVIKVRTCRLFPRSISSFIKPFFALDRFHSSGELRRPRSTGHLSFCISLQPHFSVVFVALHSLALHSLCSRGSASYIRVLQELRSPGRGSPLVFMNDAASIEVVGQKRSAPLNRAVIPVTPPLFRRKLVPAAPVALVAPPSSSSSAPASSMSCRRFLIRPVSSVVF